MAKILQAASHYFQVLHKLLTELHQRFAIWRHQFGVSWNWTASLMCNTRKLAILYVHVFSGVLPSVVMKA